MNNFVMLKVSDVALRLSSSISWVYKEVEKGNFPCTRIGTLIRFTEEQYLLYIKEHQQYRRNLTVPSNNDGPDKRVIDQLNNNGGGI